MPPRRCQTQVLFSTCDHSWHQPSHLLNLGVWDGTFAAVVITPLLLRLLVLDLLVLRLAALQLVVVQLEALGMIVVQTGVKGLDVVQFGVLGMIVVPQPDPHQPDYSIPTPQHPRFHNLHLHPHPYPHQHDPAKAIQEQPLTASYVPDVPAYSHPKLSAPTPTPYQTPTVIIQQRPQQLHFQDHKAVFWLFGMVFRR